MSETLVSAEIIPGPRVRRIHANKFKLAEYTRAVHAIRLESGSDIAFEDVLKKEFFAHVAAKLRVGDRIEVEPEQGGWFAELRVQRIISGQTEKPEVFVAVLRHVNLEVADTFGSINDYDVKWQVGSKSFGVIRKRDGALVQGGFADKAAAAAWLGEQSALAA